MSVQGKIRRIVLNNVLSWPTGCIDLHPGLNVVVGPSDSGKTNVYRAAKAVVENAPATRFLSIGKSSGSASIEFDDGSAVHLGKGVGKSTANEYEARVGGVSQVYKQVGSECPPPVASVLRLGPVSLSGIEADVHFCSQRGPAFGVDAKPGDLAKIIGAVSGLDVVYVALGESEKIRRSAQIEDTSANADYERKRDEYRSRSSAFSFEQTKSYREQIRGLVESVSESQGRSAKLRRIADEFGKVSSDVVRWTTASESLQKVVDRMTSIGKALSESMIRADRLRKIARDVESLAVEIKSRTAEASKAEDDLVAAELAVRDLVKTKCPLCGRGAKP